MRTRWERMCSRPGYSRLVREWVDAVGRVNRFEVVTEERSEIGDGE